MIRVGPAKSPRITRAERRMESIASLLKNSGLAQRPPHHQAHHVVPDAVVRKHPLQTYGAVDKLPDKVIEEAALKIHRRAWEILHTWKGPHLE